MKINLFIICMIISSTLFANAVARVSAVKGKVIVTRDAIHLNAIKGFLVKEKDNIITKDKAQVQLIFKDETIISIGKNSNFSIEEYLFLDTKKPVAKFKLLNGMMRAITGKIGKIAPDKFTVRVKTATIGIRGTNFGLMLKNGNLHQSFCTSGAIDVKIKTKKHLLKEGFFMRISKSGKVKIRKFTNDDMKIIKRNSFIINKEFINITRKNVKTITKNQINKKTPIKKNNLETGEVTKGNLNISSKVEIGDNSKITNSNLGVMIGD